VRELARDVGDDGGRFVLVGRDGDLGALDVAGLTSDGIPTVGIEAALTRQDEVLIPNDGHPNELGHARIAELLADELQPGLEELMR
jgi:lysophospholipase L1-like esterase